MKHEIRVEYSNNQALLEVIEKAYFNDSLGKISGKHNFIKVDESDDIMFTILNGLHNATVKITNSDVIDGAMRFIIDESYNELRIYPISIYCIKEQDKYSFY